MNLCTPQIRSINKTIPIVILGNGSFGKDVYNALVKQGYNIEKIITSENLFSYQNKDAQLLIAVFNRNTPYNKLVNESISAGFFKVFLPYEYYPIVKEELGWRYWLSSPDLIMKNIYNLKKVSDLLEDYHSKWLLQSICEFRIGNNLTYSQHVDVDNQYFNSLTFKSNINFYIDGGAYNGDSYIELQKYSKVKNAVLFEPDTNNFQKLTKTVSNAICLPLAISDSTKMLCFNSGQGESSTLVAQGDSKVMAVSLDDMFVNIDIDFIKLDLEGGEIPALLGSANLLKKSRPIIAMSLYHKPNDIWDIPLTLSSICKDYKFYIRQHYYNSFDSVLYAIPK